MNTPCLRTMFASLMLLSPLSAVHAAVNINSIPVPDPFPAIPAVANWSTLSIGAGSVVITPTAFDTKVIAAADAAAITTVLGSSGTIPPSANGIARWNDGTATVPVGITFLQTRPTGVDYLLLLAHLSNATGGPLSSVKVAYDYSTDTNTVVEDVEGLRAYWSVTGTPGSWALIPELSIDTAATYAAPQAVSATIALPSPLAAGGNMFLLFADQNSTVNPDASYHIDNFAASSGTSINCTVTGTPSSIVRNPGADPTNPADDTVNFTLTVTGTGAVSPSGWKVTAPASLVGISNAYGTPQAFTNVAISTFTSGRLAVTVEDADTAACRTIVNVDIAQAIGRNIAGGNRPILTNAYVATGWVIDETALTATQNAQPAQADHVIDSEIIDLTALGTVRFSADLDAITGTSSGFEAADAFGLELIIDGAAPVSVLGAADTDSNGFLNGAAAAGGTELPDTTLVSTTKSFSFSSVIPASANSVQIRIIGNSNSPNETFLVKNVKLDAAGNTLFAAPSGPVTLNNRGTIDPSDDQFSGPVDITAVSLPGTGWTSDATPASGLYTTPNPVIFGPFPASGGAKTVNIADNVDSSKTATFTLNLPVTTLTVSPATNITRHANGPGLDDDTVTFDVTVTGANGGPSWTATGGTPAAGNFGAVTFIVPAGPGTSTASVVITDASYASATQTVNVAFPVTYIIGQKNFGGGLQDVSSLTVVDPDTLWVNDAAARTLTMNNGNTAGAGINKVITSEVISLSGVSGTVQFSANLHVNDKTSGFEAGDNFVATLIYNGDTANPVSLVTAYDTDASGRMNGSELAPPPAVNPTVQDFDYPLSATIPAGTTSVQLVISGLNDSNNETMIVSGVLFTGTTSGGGDSDGDGVSDANEAIMGTNPNDASDVLRLSQNAGNPTLINFPSKPGVFYRVYVSDDTNGQEATHLRVWKDAGLPTIVGNGGSKSFTVTVLPAEKRRFYRLHVMGTNGPWPATYP